MSFRGSFAQKPPVVTVTLTPAVDLSIPVDQLIPGRLHRVPGIRQDAGGKGINVAKGLHAFGIPAIATGLIGGSRGQFIQTTLTGLGVMHHFVETPHETRVNVKITDGKGQLTEFNSPSTVTSPEQWAELEHWIFEQSVPGQWLALCGRLPDGAKEDWYARIAERARQHGMRTVLDASGVGLHEGMKAKPDIAKPNRAELSQFVGRTLTTIEEIVHAGLSLIEQGVGSVVVSLGEEGLVGIRNNEIYHVRVPVIRAISSVGAGDTLVAGLLYGSYHGYSFADTLRFGAAAGTAAVKMPGSKQPSLTEALNLLEETRVTAFA